MYVKREEGLSPKYKFVFNICIGFHILLFFCLHFVSPSLSFGI